MITVSLRYCVPILALGFLLSCNFNVPDEQQPDDVQDVDQMEQDLLAQVRANCANFDDQTIMTFIEEVIELLNAAAPEEKAALIRFEFCADNFTGDDVSACEECQKVVISAVYP